MNNQEISYLHSIPKTERSDVFMTKEWFEPKNKIELWDWIIMYTTDKIIDRRWRPLLIWYVIEWWQLHLRLFYRSNSEWCWRSCPGMREDRGYSKWEFIKNSSYETTTKIDPTIWQIFDKLSEIRKENSPILDIFKKYLNLFIEGNSKLHWIEVLQQEMNTAITVDKLFESWKDNAVDYYMRQTSQDVVDFYNSGESVPEWLDYEHMAYTWKSYSYIHHYLWEVIVEVYTIERNGMNLDFHFAKASNSQDKVRIENVVYSDAKINSFWVYDKQINAWPLVAKPIDYRSQAPRDWDWTPYWQESWQDYVDIRDLYQWNPIIKRYKGIRE
jgi:hypothetical protein